MFCKLGVDGRCVDLGSTKLGFMPTAFAGKGERQNKKSSKKKKLKKMLSCLLPGKQKDPRDLVYDFIEAQAAFQDIALKELRAGQKRSHWSWYIFPTPPNIICGVEMGSEKCKQYALRTREQAEAYLSLPPQDVVVGPPLKGGQSEKQTKQQTKQVHLRANYIEVMETIADQLEQDEELTLNQLIGMGDVPKLRSSLNYFRNIASTMDPPDEEVVQVCDRTLEAIEEGNGWVQSLRESLNGIYG